MGLVTKHEIGMDVESALVIGDGADAVFIHFAELSGRREIKVISEGPKHVRIRREKVYQRDMKDRERVVPFPATPVIPNTPTPPEPNPHRAA